MSEPIVRCSILVRLYRHYLHDEDSAQLIAGIAQNYTLGTLLRLLESVDVNSKRAAGLALGLIGDETCLDDLGKHLRSNDRKLRLVVDDAIRAIASRQGSLETRQTLEQIIRYNECGRFQNAIDAATHLINVGNSHAELYHQRSLALFQLGLIKHSINDCLQCLKLNRYHYAAMVGLGHCHQQLDDLINSLFWFRQALDLFPDLEPVRIEVKKLERAIQESQ